MHEAKRIIQTIISLSNTHRISSEWNHPIQCAIFIQAGNDFEDEYKELQYVMPQIMIIKLRVEEPRIVFDPPFVECRNIILRCFSEIITSAEGLQRVRQSLIPQILQLGQQKRVSVLPFRCQNMGRSVGNLFFFFLLPLCAYISQFGKKW